MWRGIQLLTTLGCVLLFSSSGLPADSSTEELATQYILPVEIDFDNGAANGNAVLTRFLPIHSFQLGDDWRLTNLAILLIANAPGGVPGSPGNPAPIAGGSVTGLGDFTDALFYTRSPNNELTWGIGPIISIPTATDDQLGSGKWSAGPAIRVVRDSKDWQFGFLAGNLTSFAGDDDRKDVNQLLVRGLLRRELKNGWFFKYSPIITANWNAEADQRWLVPLGGGIGKTIKLQSTSINLAAEINKNVVRPDGAPDWVFRLSFVVPLSPVESE